MEKWESARIIAESMATKFPEVPHWWIAWAYALRREKDINEARENLRHEACEQDAEHGWDVDGWPDRFKLILEFPIQREDNHP